MICAVNRYFFGVDELSTSDSLWFYGFYGFVGAITIIIGVITI